MLHTSTAQETERQHFLFEPFPLSAQEPSNPVGESAPAYWMQDLFSPGAKVVAFSVNVPSTWQQVGGATSILTQQDVDSLDRLYAFRRRDEVISFLSDHPFLVELLQEAHGEIQIYFNSYLQMTLEVVADPEAIDDRELVLFIHTELPPVEALASLHRLDEDWWLDASDASRGKLCIHVEYQ